MKFNSQWNSDPSVHRATSSGSGVGGHDENRPTFLSYNTKSDEIKIFRQKNDVPIDETAGMTMA
jgi:hypothetical protein